MNGAVGNYNAHLSAYPEHDWEAFSRQVVEGALGSELQPFTIQIEPHDYMAELFDAFTRVDTIPIDGARCLGLHQPGLLQSRRPRRARSAPRPCRTRSTRSTPENAEGNFGIASALLTHLAQKLPVSRWQRDPTGSDRAAQHGRGAGLCCCWAATA